MAAGQPRLQVKISADASDAVTAFKEAAVGLKGMGAASEDVAKQSEAVAAALVKVGNSTDSPGKLASATQQAAIKVKDLKEALDAAEVAGETMPVGLVGALEKAEAALSGSKTRLAQFKTALDEVGVAGQEAGAKVAAGVAKAEPKLTEVQVAAKKLEVELEALGKADTARGLAQGSARAKVALDDLEEAAKTAGVSVDKFGVNVKDAEGKINAAAGKAGSLRDAMGDMTTRGNLAAQGMEAMAGKAGSLDGVLSMVKDTGGKTSGIIADLGFSALAAEGAFKLLKTAADGIVEGSKAIGAAYVEYVQKQVDAQVEMAKATQAARMLGVELPKTAAGVHELALAFDRLAPNAKVAQKQLDDWVKTVDGVKIPKSFDEIKVSAAALEAKLADVFAKGGAAVVSFGKENDGVLRAVAEQYKVNGQAVPDHIAKTIKALDEWGKAEDKNKKAVEDSKLAGEDKLKSMIRIYEQQQKAIEEANKLLDANQKEKKSTEELDKALAAIAAKYNLTVDGLADLVKKSKDAEKEFEAGRKTAEGYAGGFDRLAASVGMAGAAMKSSAKDFAEANDAARRNADAFGSIADAAGRVSGGTTALTTGFERLKGGTEDATKAIDLHGATLEENFNSLTPAYAKAIADASEKTQDMKRTAAQAAAGVDQFGASVTGAGKAIGTVSDVMGDGVKKLEDYGQKWVEVGAAMSASTTGFRAIVPAIDGAADSAEKLFQQLSYLSKTNMATTIWVEPLITDLEKGSISIAQFTSQMNEMQKAASFFQVYGMGTAVEFQLMLSKMALAEQEYYDASEKRRKEAIKKAQDDATAAKKHAIDAIAAANKEFAASLAPGQSGSQSFDAQGNLISGGGAGGGMTSGGGSTNSSAPGSFVLELAKVPKS